MSILVHKFNLTVQYSIVMEAIALPKLIPDYLSLPVGKDVNK